MMRFFTLYLLPACLAGSMAYLLFWVARPLCRRLGPRFGRGLLLGAACLFLLPLTLPVLALPAPNATAAENHTLWRAPPTAMAYSAGENLNAALSPAPAATPATEAPPRAAQDAATQAPRRTPALFQLLAVGYLAGLAASLLVTGLRWAAMRRRLAALPPGRPDDTLLAMYDALCRELQIRRAPKLLVSGGVHSPVLSGVLHPVVFLPAGMGADTAGFALRHELCHHKHRDVPAKLLLLLLGALHWYNPLVHLLRRDFNELSEAACDAAVADGLEPAQRGRYAETLLHFAAAPLPLAAGFSGPAKKLKKRLEALLRPVRPGPRAKAAGALMAAALLLCSLVAGCSMTAGASATQSQTAPPADSMADTPLPASSSAAESAAEPAGASGESESTDATAPPSSAPHSQPDTMADDAAANGGNTSPAFIFPVETATQISRLGGPGMNHRGVDFKGETGTLIYAAADGTVVTADAHYSYGNYVVIEHPDGLHTLYAHCDSLLVSAGDSVAQGDTIATMGQTGFSESPHLHLEVSTAEGELLQPMDYFEDVIPADLPR